MQYILVFSHGHSGGGWMNHNMNLHPAGRITGVGELHKHNGLDFKRRGIPLSRLSEETIKLFHDREYYGDVCVSVFKSFREPVMKYVREHDGLICCAVRNPIHIVGKRYKHKMGPAQTSFRRIYHRPMVTDDEIFEGHVMYYALDKYKVFLGRAGQYPIYRLEDMNSSCGGDGAYYKRFMECLTRTEWPWDYIRYIQEYHLPCHLYDVKVIWDDEGRVCGTMRRVRKVLRDSGEYCNFGPDPSVPKYWNNWTDNQKEIYQKWFGELDKRLGYNQQHAGSVDDWEWSGKYEWGSP